VTVAGVLRRGVALHQDFGALDPGRGHRQSRAFKANRKLHLCALLLSAKR